MGREEYPLTSGCLHETYQSISNHRTHHGGFDFFSCELTARTDDSLEFTVTSDLLFLRA